MYVCLFIYPILSFRDSFIDDEKRPRNRLGSRFFDFLWSYEDENSQVSILSNLISCEGKVCISRQYDVIELCKNAGA